MEVEEPLQLHPQSHDSPVRGMERVVVTVSGYHGSERFNLIKLISRAGANYVGTMSKSVTHLVCWKFEGKKYDIAQKLNIFIVNHRWIEDCIKEGRRVPENSYILQSGHEVGPLLLDVPLTVQTSSLAKNKVIIDSLDHIGSIMQTNEFSSGASGNSVWEDSFFMSKHEESSSYSSRQTRKLKRNICGGDGVRTVAGPSRKERRLGKNIDVVDLDPLHSDSSPDSEDHLNRMDRLHTDAGGVSNTLTLENREAMDAGLYDPSGITNGASNGIEQIKDSNNIFTARNSSIFIEDPLPLAQKSKDLCSSPEKFTDGDQFDNVSSLHTSKELSCVICFTYFSSTRGILPCGHRFCFHCIQRWVDHRNSMGKKSTCPLCLTSFVVIKKVDHAASTDQKVYSQTIPCDDSAKDVFTPLDLEFPGSSIEAGACVVCRGREPEELLKSCIVCKSRRIHRYCLDPPLFPWTCSPCKELRRRNFR